MVNEPDPFSGPLFLDVASLIQDAIELHFAGMRVDDDGTPLPSSHVECIDVAA